jgi:hypothetical protein
MCACHLCLHHLQVQSTMLLSRMLSVRQVLSCIQGIGKMGRRVVSNVLQVCPWLDHLLCICLDATISATPPCELCNVSLHVCVCASVHVRCQARTLPICFAYLQHQTHCPVAVGSLWLFCFSCAPRHEIKRFMTGGKLSKVVQQLHHSPCVHSSVVRSLSM